MKPTLSFGLAFSHKKPSSSKLELMIAQRTTLMPGSEANRWNVQPVGWVFFNAPTSHMWLPGFRDSGIPKFESSPHRFRWGNGCHFPLFHRCEYPEKKGFLEGDPASFWEGRPIFKGNHHCCRTRQTPQGCHHKAPSQDGIFTPNKQPTP